jgi:hypothetical protein
VLQCGGSRAGLCLVHLVLCSRHVLILGVEYRVIQTDKSEDYASQAKNVREEIGLTVAVVSKNFSSFAGYADALADYFATRPQKEFAP